MDNGKIRHDISLHLPSTSYAIPIHPYNESEEIRFTRKVRNLCTGNLNLFFPYIIFAAYLTVGMMITVCMYFFGKKNIKITNA